MLQVTLPKVRDCLAKAAEARRKALATGDPETRAFWLGMEGRWLRLAASYEDGDRTAVFLGSVKKTDTNEGPGRI